MIVVLAHAAHWLEGVAFGAPAIALPAGLAALVWRDRRRERREGAV